MGSALRSVVALAAAGLCSAALAQSPSKPIRLVLQFPAGGTADAVARILAQPLSQVLVHRLMSPPRPAKEAPCHERRTRPV